MINKKIRQFIIIFLVLIILISVTLSTKMFYTFKKVSEMSFSDIKFINIYNIFFAAVIIGLCLMGFMFLIISKKYSNRIKEIKESKDVDIVCNISNMNRFIADAEIILNKRGNDKFALLHIDIDKFSMVNDRFGHSTGDEVLLEIGCFLTDTFENEQLYCRTYADNFLVLYRYKLNQAELFKKVFSISTAIENLNTWRVLNLSPVITTGIYFIEEENCDIRIAIDKAKLAKRSIKGGYKSCYAVYDESMRYILIEEKKIEDDMYYALKNNEFKVFLQPKINLLNGFISGAEALVRWEHPLLGFMAPIKFIPIFEKNGFITILDKFVFECVCIHLRKWLDNNYDIVPISVNVSRLHFLSDNFVQEYKSIMEKYNIPIGLIEIEITESVVFGNTSEIFSIMKNFRDNGFNISMDDFGSGYSSLGLLREIPIDTLKLDKTFLEHIEDYNARMIVSNVVNLAKNLKLNVVSEGVDSDEQVEFLKNIGCDMAQGFIFSRPIPISEYEKLIYMKRKNFFNLNNVALVSS
nr:GGDEF domain-containing phosphodiesterase [Sedimentibacter sp.]